jgi:hypothetical protein
MLRRLGRTKADPASVTSRFRNLVAPALARLLLTHRDFDHMIFASERERPHHGLVARMIQRAAGRRPSREGGSVREGGSPHKLKSAVPVSFGSDGERCSSRKTRNLAICV